jgi:ATP-dependent helicase/nuclease subunit B
MTPELLAEYAEKLPQGISREKLKDLALIYTQYENVLGQRFSDSEDQLTYVAGRLGASSYLRGKHLYVYGFDTLPDQMMRFLAAAAHQCESLTVALLCDGVSAPDGELFLPVRQGVGRFMDLLAEGGLSARMIPLPPKPLGTAPVFEHLDRELFALTPKVFEADQQQVYVYDGLSPHEEATLMSRQVMRLMAEGMDVERIAVLYPDANGYGFAVSTALRDSGIPFYADQKLPALSHGLVRYLLCAMRAISDGYRNRDVLGLLKSGYAPLAYDECCRLENYAFAYGIDRERWLKPFTRGSEQEKRSAMLRAPGSFSPGENSLSISVRR